MPRKRGKFSPVEELNGGEKDRFAFRGKRNSVGVGELNGPNLVASDHPHADSLACQLQDVDGPKQWVKAYGVAFASDAQKALCAVEVETANPKDALSLFEQDGVREHCSGD